MKNLLFSISATTWALGIMACSQTQKNEPNSITHSGLIEKNLASEVVSIKKTDTSVIVKEDIMDSLKTGKSTSTEERKSTGEKSIQLETSTGKSNKSSKNEKKDEAYQSYSKTEVKEAPRHEAPNQGKIEKIKKEKENLKRPK